jgi:polysaccharide pyruvyl transferase WcaK-like protein
LAAVPELTRCLIVNAYSAQNLGDAAINIATAALLRARGAAKVGISGRYHRHDKPFYSRYEISAVPPAIPFAPPGDGGVVARGIELAAGMLWAALVLIPFAIGLPQVSQMLARWSDSTGLVELLAADLVVLAGGGYIFSSSRRINASLIHSLAIVWLVLLTRKRVVMMPQSIGPMRGRFDRWMVKKTLARVHPLVVREKSGLAELTEFVDPGDIRVCPDISLFGWSTPVDVHRHHADGRRIGVAVMDWTWARDAGQSELDRYCSELAALIVDMGRASVDVVLLAGSRLPDVGQDDKVVAREISHLVTLRGGDEPEILDVSDPESFQSHVAKLDVVVGTRLHSCLLALSRGVPAIGLGYQPKTRGSYELLGINELLHDVESFTAAGLARQIHGILSHESEWRERVEDAAARARAQIGEIYSKLI